MESTPSSSPSPAYSETNIHGSNNTTVASSSTTSDPQSPTSKFKWSASVAELKDSVGELTKSVEFSKNTLADIQEDRKKGFSQSRQGSSMSNLMTGSAFDISHSHKDREVHNGSNLKKKLMSASTDNIRSHSETLANGSWSDVSKSRGMCIETCL